MTEAEILKIARERGGTIGQSMAEMAATREAYRTQKIDLSGASKLSTRARGRPKHEPGRMNKSEKLHSLLLDERIALGEVAAYWFESVKLRLADKTWLCPDFLVMLSDGTLQFEEVKGHMEDDSAVKLKVAARLYPQFKFVIFFKDKAVVVSNR